MSEQIRTNSTKKVLIVTYYWPPSGGPGMQRVLKFVKYLPSLGWTPIILTVKNGEYPAIDETLLKEIPKECKVYSTKTIEFFNFFKKITGRKKIETYILNQENPSVFERLSRWVRLNLFVPDGRVGWYYFAVKKGIDIIKREKPDIIFSCSPPHSVQLIGKRLAEKTGVKWVADFRDPWTEAFWDKGLKRISWAKKRNLAYEEQVLVKANTLTTVSKGFAKKLAKKEPNRFIILPNGYDGSDFNIEKTQSKKFRITYTGHIAKSQNPVNFFKALTSIPKDFKELLEVKFFGSFDISVQESIKEMNLEQIVNLNPYVTHDKALEHMVNSELLLLLIPKKNGEGIMTGKLYEYLASKNFILGLGEEKGEVAEVLEECNSGVIVNYEADVHGLIMDRINKWRNGEPLSVKEDQVLKYDRKHLTENLVSIFKQTLESQKQVENFPRT